MSNCTVPAILFFLLSVLVSCEYSEIVKATYLPNNNLLTEASFKLSQEFPFPLTEDKVFGTFPSLIYALPSEFGLEAGKIAFTRGKWESSKWGKCATDTTSSGFQFNGQFKDQFSNLCIEERFNLAIELISGYFCASLNTLKYSNAIKPTIPSFEMASAVSSTILIGIIPSEPLCIENLLPWLDLLPCGNRAGLAEMFKPEAIYQSDFHSIQIQFSSREDHGSLFIEMNMRMTTVYDLNQWERNNNWSLSGLFGKSFVKPCPIVSNDPTVILLMPNSPEYINSLHQQKDTVSSCGNHLVVEYSGIDLLSEIGAIDVPKFNEFINPPNPFRAYRFKSGTTDDFGGFGLVLENDLNIQIEITVIESIPWLFNVFLHKGEFALNSVVIPPSRLSEYLKEFSIEPAVNRKRPLLLQSKWILPPKSHLQLYFPFEREFLRIDEFPHNSDRGIELPGALIIYKHEHLVTETTNTLLFQWPIPDGTMPFNVITMTSTLAALFYGSFFNAIFRRFYLKHPNDPPPGVIPKLLWNLKKNLLKSK